MHPAGWIIVAAVCAAIEMATPSFFIGWFAVGAVAGALMSLLRVGLVGQTLVFLVVSIGLVLGTKRLSASWTKKGPATRTNVDALVGRSAIITREIPDNGMGQAKVMGEVWTAESLGGRRIPAGVTVKVIRVDGVHLVVKSPE